MGNVIAEYEKTGTNDAEWMIDYVYGAAGEAVYIQFPQTTTMNMELDNFVAFVEAWLCEPNCTTADLLWDYNDDDQIDLTDWAADVNDFDEAFTINGRYLLTDFRNSVIGKVNLDGSVDEITYDAWGTSTVDAGAELEGLPILWNGYYYDAETDNYYLRNRYYSPLERKFVTDDPHSTNPDGTWKNWFNIQRQYQDGYGLQVYVQGDPVNNIDPWGLRKVCCKTRTTHIVDMPCVLCGPGPSSTMTYRTCNQVTYDIGEGTANAENFCKCKYRYMPNIEVVGSKEDECKWCDVSFQFVASHTVVFVKCENWSKTIEISLLQDTSGTNNPYMHINDGERYYGSLMFFTSKTCRTSEGKATSVVDDLNSYPMEHWYNYIVNLGCWGFSSQLFGNLCNQCL